MKLLLAEHTDIAGSETEICRLKHHLCRRDRRIDLPVVLHISLTVPGLCRIIRDNKDHRCMELACGTLLRLL